MNIDLDSAGVRVPPPILLLITVMAGAALQFFFPLPFIRSSLRWPFAFIFLISGFSLILHCAAIFDRQKTDIKPWKPTTSLITSGIYRISRNPIYLAFLLLGCGLAFVFNNLWIALLQPGLLFVLAKYVVAREERYLLKKFGADYENYCKAVPRWLLF